ncbi:MAG: lysophospholipase [Rickettsiales bacterium]
MFKKLALLAFLNVLIACAPQQQAFVSQPAATQKLEANVFYTADMAALPYRAWLPKHNIRAVVIALHGFNDYSNAFSEVGEYFSSKEVALYAYDQRGFGGAPQAGIWGNSKNLTGDLVQFTQLVSKRHPHMPLYIMGESMGGAVAISTVANHRLEVDGLVLIAPAVWGGETMPWIYRGTLWASAHTFPYWQMTGSDLKIMATDNIELLRKMVADPLIIKSTRVDAIYGLVGLMDDAYHAIPKLTMPTLILYGGNDQVIKREPIEVALARFSKPVTFAYYPEGYHMLMRDLAAKLVMDDAISWMKRPSHQLPSGFAKEIKPLEN